MKKNETMFKIHSIFSSIEGEGIWIGSPTIFVRFQGCTIKCKNCDTPEAIRKNEGINYTVNQIIEEITAFGDGVKRVSLTGGNPLEQNPQLLNRLIIELFSLGYVVNLELPGVEDLKTCAIEEDTHYLHEILHGCQISLDVKTPCTDLYELSKYTFENEYQSGGVLGDLSLDYQVKMIIKDEKDIKALLEIAELINKTTLCIPLVATPIWNIGEKTLDMDIVRKLLEISVKNPVLNKMDFRIIPQMHKFLWGHEKNK